MDFLGNCLNPASWSGYESVVNAIIRPPRANYSTEMLGPSHVTMNGIRFRRQDFDLVNGRGRVLTCSHWTPVDPNIVLPCVVYLHGNAGCRADALSVANVVLALGISLFALDFSGCGQSDGEYISLGWWEREDVKVVVEYLRNLPSVSTIGLWGRSMGAATALLHGDRDPSIAGMVVDSPFTSLTTLAHELVGHHVPNLPSFMTSTVLAMVASSCKDKCDFEIADLEPIQHVNECFIPTLFATGDKDVFIAPHHAHELHEKHAGDNEMVVFGGDHNSSRTPEFFEKAAIFLHTRLTHAAATLSVSYQKRASQTAPGPEQEMQTPARVPDGAERFMICGNCQIMVQPPGTAAFRCPGCGVVLEDTEIATRVGQRPDQGCTCGCIVT